MICDRKLHKKNSIEFGCDPVVIVGIAPKLNLNILVISTSNLEHKITNKSFFFFFFFYDIFSKKIV